MTRQMGLTQEEQTGHAAGARELVTLRFADDLQPEV